MDRSAAPDSGYSLRLPAPNSHLGPAAGTDLTKRDSFIRRFRGWGVAPPLRSGVLREGFQGERGAGM